MSTSREVVEYVLKLGEELPAQATRAAGAVRSVGDAAKETERGVKSLEGAAKQAAALMGGSFGQIGQIVFELGDKVGAASGAIGALGVAGLGAVAGVAAAGIAVKSIADAALDAADRLEKAGKAGEIPPETLASLRAYRGVLAEITEQMDVATTVAGGVFATQFLGAHALLEKITEKASAFADSIRDMHARLVEAAPWIERLEDWLSKAAAGFGQFVALATGGGSAAIVGLIRSMGVEAVEAAPQIESLSKIALDTNQSMLEAEDERRRKQAELAKAALDKQARDAEAARKKEEADEKAHQTKMEQIAKEAARAKAEAAKEALAAQTSQADAIRAAELADQVSAYKAAAASSAADSASAAQTGATVSSLDRLASTIAQQQASMGGALGEALMAALQGGGLSQVLGGGLSGLAGLAGGPVGGAIQLGLQIPDLIDQVAAFEDRLISEFTALPDRFANALGEKLPQILDRLPDLADAILEAAVRLPLAITDSLPAIVESTAALLPALIQTVLDHLPEILVFSLTHTLSAIFLGGPFTIEIVKGLAMGLDSLLGGLPSRIAEAIAEVLGRALDPLRDQQGRVLGTDLTAAKGEKTLFGAHLPFFDDGARRVTRSGLAVIHQGERIERAGAASRSRSSGGPVTINVHGGDTHEVVRQIRQLLGDYGSGLELGALP